MSIIAEFRNTDWIKDASAAKLDKEKMEQVFGDQAFSFISSKAGPLMEPGHLLGFEVIHHNEDNTKLVGIFAFRVKDKLLYAPVFFLRGQIKGDHFLYNVKTRLFKPLSEAQAKKEIDQSTSESGRAMRRMDTDRSRFGNNLTQIMYHPYQLKGEGFKSAFLQGRTPEAAIDATFCPVDGNVKAAGLLSAFIQKAGIKCAATLHNTLESHAEFTDALMRVLGDDFESQVFPEMPRIKQASAPEPELQFGTFVKAAASEFEHATFLKHGFWAYDARKNPEVKSEVYSMNDELETVQPGNAYELPVVSKKSQQEGIIGSSETLKDFDSQYSFRHSFPEPVCRHGSHNPAPATHVCVYFKGSKALATDLNGADIAGRPVLSLPVPQEDDGAKEPKAGKMYAIYDTGGKTFADEVMFCSAVRKAPAIGKLAILHRADRWGVSPNGMKVMLHPDLDECDFGAGVLGTCARFFEVESEEITGNDRTPQPVSTEIETQLPDRRPVAPPVIMPRHLAADALLRQGLFDMTAQWSAGAYDFDFGGGKLKRAFSTLEAAQFLTAGLGIGAPDALDIIETARGTPNRDSRYAVEPGTKIASAVFRMTSHPDLFTPGYDSHYNVRTDPERNFRVATETHVHQPRLMRINEAAVPQGEDNEDHIPTAQIITMEPGQIKETMKAKNLPFAFEHGVIGGLIDTFDAGHMLDEYLPALETGLDRLGRLLFLFYWKPQDYEKLFGADELLQRENELLSLFLSFGKTLLNLQKKPKKQDDAGSGALT